MTSKKYITRTLRRLRHAGVLKPSEQFAKNARIRFLNRVPESPALSIFRNRPMMVTVFRFALLGILGCILLGESILYIANYSEPGGFLYPVKVATEQKFRKSSQKGSQKTPIELQEATDAASGIIPSPVNDGTSEPTSPVTAPTLTEFRATVAPTPELSITPKTVSDDDTTLTLPAILPTVKPTLPVLPQ